MAEQETPTLVAEGNNQKKKHRKDDFMFNEQRLIWIVWVALIMFLDS